jgi:hypothetical protein
MILKFVLFKSKKLNIYNFNIIPIFYKDYYLNAEKKKNEKTIP